MSIFTHVKNSLSIADVIGEYISLKRGGLYLKGSCPFHHEKTASFTVSPHKEIFYCFGCKEGGDVISFIAKMERCTQIEAVNHLIERYNISVPDELRKEAPTTSSDVKKRFYLLHELIAKWCHQQLINSPRARRYITDRGIERATMDRFQIGYFPGGPESIKRLLNDMRAHSFLAKDLVDWHILNEGKTTLYSPFEERIIFPIKDHLGRHCGFGGRVFQADDERAKYYNSRESSFFQKGSLIFGLDLAREAIQKKESVFLVEGYMDCTMMAQHGFTNTVATLGTSCTAEHLKILSRYAQQLFVIYDGDNAGRQAILRLTELCWQVELDLNVVCLPADQDPASILSRGGNLQEMIDHAVDIFTFFVESISHGFEEKSLRDKMQTTKRLIETVSRVESPLKQDMLLHTAAQKLSVPFATLKAELTRSSGSSKPSYQAPQEPTKSLELRELSSMPEIPALEKKIFSAIINNAELFSHEHEEYLIEYMPEPLCSMLSTLKSLKDTDPSTGFIQLFDQLTAGQKQLVLQLAAADQEVDHELFEQLILQLQKKHWKEITHTIKLKLEHAKNTQNEAEATRLVTEFLRLKKKLLHKQLI